MNVLCIQHDAREAALIRAELAPIDVVPTLEEARAWLAGGRTYDLVLLDVNLPGGQALELLAALREQALPAPVIVSVGAAGAVAAVRALRGLGNAPEPDSALQAQLLDAAPVIVLILDPQGTIRHVNAYFERLTGYRLDEVRGKEWFSTFLPERDRDRIRDLFRTSLGDAPTRGNVNPIVTRDAREIEIEWYDQMMRDDSGRVVSLLAIGQDVSARLRAEESLRASEERYRSLVEYSPVGIYVHDGETVLFSNQGFAEILGATSPDDVVGRTLASIVHPGDRARVKERVEALRGGLLVNPVFVGRIVRLDGEVRYGQVTATACTFGGKPAIQVLLIDVTEQHNAQVALRERDEKLLANAARLNEAQRLARMGSWELDLANNALTWSDEIFRIFEIEKERFGASYDAFLAAIHPDDRDAVDAAYQASVANRQPYEITHRLLMSDGRLKYVQERGETHYGPAGEPLRSVGTVQDITERRLTEQALRLLSTGVVHLSGEAFFGEITTRMAALLGVEIGFVDAVVPGDPRRVRMLGMSVDGVSAPPMEREIGGTPCESAGAEGCMYPEGVRARFPLDPDLARMRVSAYAAIPLFDSTGTLTGHIGVMSRAPFQHADRIEATLRLFAVRAGAEIERMRAEEERHGLETQLRQSQKMQAIGTLAGGIAHDFNNILSAIVGNTDLMAMEIDRDHPAAATIGEIRKASSRAKDLVAQILTFSSQREQPRALISLWPMADEVVRLLRVALPAQVELVRTFDRATPTVLADPTQMHQLMMNLCTNAWQSLDGAPGRIEIRLESVDVDADTARRHPGLQPGLHARFVVADTGIGMDAATLERIYEPFFTTKGVGAGTGLGLAVAHGIVTAHGGTIAVRSTPGEGSVFEAYFPARSLAPAEPAAPGSEPQRGHGQRIVYVDDEPSLVRLTTRLLERAGYRVTGFTDPAEALRAIRAAPADFDALLTDLSMPGMSGFDLIRGVKAVRPDVPVALTTGYPTDEMHGEAEAVGCREILIKPARSEDLERLFERLFAASRERGA